RSGSADVSCIMPASERAGWSSYPTRGQRTRAELYFQQLDKLNEGDQTSGAESHGGGEQEASGVWIVERGRGTGASADCTDHSDGGNALALPEQAAILDYADLAVVTQALGVFLLTKMDVQSSYKIL
ncbi:MAG TPA: hypothetical protein VMS31_05940, partial [Pyrinomonadaceae bacterium]|nr:hypothetical protein [Pyrinomonadaceae bacterium]